MAAAAPVKTAALVATAALAPMTAVAGMAEGVVVLMVVVAGVAVVSAEANEPAVIMIANRTSLILFLPTAIAAFVCSDGERDGSGSGGGSGGGGRRHRLGGACIPDSGSGGGTVLNQMAS